MCLDGFSPCNNKVDFACQHIAVNAEQIGKVERQTKGQRLNPNFGAVLQILSSSSHRLPSQSLLKSLLGNADLWSVHAIQWGVQHEETAIKGCEVCKGESVIPSGLWLSPSSLIAMSSDDLVNHDQAIDLKCSYSARSTSLIEQAKDKKPFSLPCPTQ